MIVDNLTKFNQKMKVWMTPKHPLFSKEVEYRIMYGAAVFMQAESCENGNPLSNFELQRLLTAGLKLESENITRVIRLAKEQSIVMDYLLEHFENEKEKYLLILDMINVSISNGKNPESIKESLSLFGKLFEVSSGHIMLLQEFAKAACEENVEKCRELLHRMHMQQMKLEPVDMKYYVMHLWESVDCTQELLEEQKHIRIVEQCVINEDLVLKHGMKLHFDHAQVRILGNILLEGGELIIENTKLIRKGKAHRACINMKDVASRILIRDSSFDCRNLGMLIRAEAGTLLMSNSEIMQTNRGAAIRFWGNELRVENCRFIHCYSHEDGGAIMVRTPNATICKCQFEHCEAKRGGAIFAVEGCQIVDCKFRLCVVAEYGAAIFYHGLVRANVHHLSYHNCLPEGVETVQYLSRMTTFQITGEYHIMVSTIIDCPVLIEAQGNLFVEDANLYLNYPIRCRGSIHMKNVKVISNHLEEQDMLILEHSKYCRIYHCEWNGMGQTGGIFASGCRIIVSKSLFHNMHSGRAIYDAYAPEIRECIFNFCEKGAIYSQNGEIKRCVFVNCRGKSGAGVLMYGNKGTIEQCNFRRCITDFSGGAIDRSLGQSVNKCVFEECRPDDVS